MSTTDDDLLVLYEVELLLDARPPRWWRRAADAAFGLLAELGAATMWLAPAEAAVHAAGALQPPGEWARAGPRRGDRGEDTYGLLMPPGLW